MISDYPKLYSFLPLRSLWLNIVGRKNKNLQQVYRNKRTYVDFEHFMDAHPDLDVVEMDTAKGGRDKGLLIVTNCTPLPEISK